jgi:hypothetical protein
MSVIDGINNINNELLKTEATNEITYQNLLVDYQLEAEQANLADLQQQANASTQTTISSGVSSPAKTATSQDWTPQTPITGYDSFRDNWVGRPTDYGGGGATNPYGYQCVALVQQYAKDVWGIDGLQGGNAVDFASNYNENQVNYTPNDPNNQNQRPPKGAVVIYGGVADNPYGHIAIVDEPGSGNSFTSFDQNVCGSSGGWGGGQGNCAPRVVNHVFDGSDGFGAVLGWLTPKS